MIEKTDLAQSEVIGVILILAITFTGISIILVTGNPSLENTKDLARTSTAENGMSLLDERVSSAALGTAGKKRVSLNLQSGKLSVDSDSGSMRIYSAPPSQVWSRSPSTGATDVNHVLNFTIEAGSDIAGNDTNPKYLDVVSVEYPGGFDTTLPTDVRSGVDTNINGTVERNLDVVGISAPTTDSLQIDVNEADSNSRLNETYMLSFEYGGIDQPPTGGEYDINVTAKNGAGESVTKETTLRIGDAVEPPERQIDTTINMGTVEYETESFVVAYQNGGVWR